MTVNNSCKDEIQVEIVLIMDHGFERSIQVFLIVERSQGYRFNGKICWFFWKMKPVFLLHGKACCWRRVPGRNRESSPRPTHFDLQQNLRPNHASFSVRSFAHIYIVIDDRIEIDDCIVRRFHDAGTYCKHTRTGGPNGSIRKPEEFEQSCNKGLKVAIDFCGTYSIYFPLINFFGTNFSFYILVLCY